MIEDVVSKIAGTRCQVRFRLAGEKEKGYNNTAVKKKKKKKQKKMMTW